MESEIVDSVICQVGIVGSVETLNYHAEEEAIARIDGLLHVPLASTRLVLPET